MKKLLTLMLAVLMTLSLAACQKKTDTSVNPTETPTATQAPTAQPKNEAILGSTTDLNADFMNGWSNSATNNYFKKLMDGYSLVAWTKESGYAVDNKITVKEYKSEVDAKGNKTYTFTINDNLVYNNGDPIKAKDYIANILFNAHPKVGDLDGYSVSGGEEFVGYEDYHKGKTNVFTGMNIINDYTFSITIKASELPYFFDLALVSLSPFPIHVIAPSAVVSQTDKGVKFEGFNIEECRKTVLDPKTGYRYKPAVTCGPYQFEYYDAATKSGAVVLNPKYLGAYDGAKGSIQRLIIKATTQQTEMDELASGAIDFVVGCADGDTINKGLDLLDKGKVGKANYPRNGYGAIFFACNYGPSQFQAVRQAVAYCLDRNEFARQFTGGYAIVVNGYYGAGQWEYEKNKEFIDKNLNAYNYNLDKAKEVLIADGWTLNEKGKAFVEGTDKIRYKKVNGKLMALKINWACSTGNKVSDLLQAMLPGEAIKVGMEIKQNPMEFSQLLEHYYQNTGTKEYNMFNLASGFAEITSYWYNFSTDLKTYGGDYNSNFLVDEELYKIALSMKKTDPLDKDGWSKKWCELQKRWNTLLPDVPLYSNDYHDFFNPRIKGFEPSSSWEWNYAVLRAHIE